MLLRALHTELGLLPHTIKHREQQLRRNTPLHRNMGRTISLLLLLLQARIPLEHHSNTLLLAATLSLLHPPPHPLNLPMDPAMSIPSRVDTHPLRL